MVWLVVEMPFEQMCKKSEFDKSVGNDVALEYVRQIINKLSTVVGTVNRAQFVSQTNQSAPALGDRLTYLFSSVRPLNEYYQSNILVR